MTLSFTQTINGKPNYFIDKIWLGLYWNNKFRLDEYRSYYWLHNDLFNKKWDSKVWAENPFNPKRHTIREDKNNRWGAGCDIHFVINNRTPNRFQFAPVIRCVSVQTITIEYFKVEGGDYFLPRVWVSGELFFNEVIGFAKMKQLAINDGFDSVEDFFAYFNKDFTGKIIHWTDLKY